MPLLSLTSFERRSISFMFAVLPRSRRLVGLSLQPVAGLCDRLEMFRHPCSDKGAVSPRIEVVSGHPSFAGDKHPSENLDSGKQITNVSAR